jgi:hypothetical protein
MLLICIHNYLKSVLRYKCFILGTHHPDTLYVREQGCEDHWLFFETEMGPGTKEFEKPCSVKILIMLFGILFYLYLHSLLNLNSFEFNQVQIVTFLSNCRESVLPGRFSEVR